MRPVYFCLILALSIAFQLSAQEADPKRESQIDRLSKHLSIPLQTAQKIDSILVEYKKGVEKASSIASDETAKRAKIDELIRLKNQRLAAILTPEQLRKIVPTTELK